MSSAMAHSVTGLLYGCHEGTCDRGVLLPLANVGFACGNVFYNAFLPEISTPENIGRISGLGWALGYIGGGTLLAINLIMLKYPGWLGRQRDFHCSRLFPLGGPVWFIFSLPHFFC